MEETRKEQGFVPVSLSERRELPRFPIRNEKIKIRLDDVEKVFAIRDLSLSGVGIELTEHTEILLFPVGDAMTAELNLRGERFSIEITVRRIDAASVGFSFQGLSAALQEEIGSTLDPLRIGGSLRLMPASDDPRAERQGISRWYHGDLNTELYLWMGMGEDVQRALLLWNSFVWEWSPATGLRTGTSVPTFEKKQEIQYDPMPQHMAVYQARKILENAPVLDYRLVDFLLRQS